MIEGSLEELLRFSDADLAANRDGRLGPGQIPRLMWSGLWRLVAGPAIAIVFLAFSLVTLDTILISLLMLIGVAFGLWLTWIGFAFLVDALDRNVAFVTGRLVANAVVAKTTTYYADIGPVHKRISRRTYDSLPSLMCHLYYAPGSRSLLSIEPADEAQPKPAHPFGADSAHVWDRLRLSWIVVTVGVLGLLIAVYGLAVAHPAHAVPVEGTVLDYVESHGKTTTRDLFLGDYSEPFTPYAEDDYSPSVQPFATLIGRSVVLYVDEGTRNVLAINDGEQMHTSDWYVNPGHEQGSLLLQATAAGVISLLVVGVGVYRIRSGLRPAQSNQASWQAVMPSRIAPPSVRHWYANWAAVVAMTLVGAFMGLVFALATHR